MEFMEEILDSKLDFTILPHMMRPKYFAKLFKNMKLLIEKNEDHICMGRMTHIMNFALARVPKEYVPPQETIE